MLQCMGVWGDLAGNSEALIEISVSDGRPEDAKALELLHVAERGEARAPSAYFVEAALLEDVLAARLEQSRHVRRVSAKVLEIRPCKGWVEAITTTGEHVRARLLIGADGKDSASRAAAGIESFEYKYPQVGIVTTIKHELPHGGRALARFLPAGPFAVLPLTGKRSSIVWTEEEQLGLSLVSGREKVFLRELRRRVGSHLGNIELAGAHRAFPLSLMIAKSFAARRIALVGDAAHVIHPLAGLGFNLGMRDIAALAEAVVEDARLGLDIGGEDNLEKYQSWRRVDTLMNATATDWLNRLFSNDDQTLRIFRDVGLRIVDRLPPLKQLLAREAAGLTGDLPKLMRGEVL
jgi:2-octaprenyl-6-methoxyphenol hydroxylase